MKRAQAAMEFLMTYGWAILVVLAAIGALAYFGVLSPDRLLPSKCTLSPGFDFGDCKAQVDGLLVSLYNGIGTDAVNVTFVVNSTQGSDVTCDESWVVASGLANGATTSVHQMCNGTYSENQRFDAQVKVIYIKSGETLDYTVSGTITRKVEQ